MECEPISNSKRLTYVPVSISISVTPICHVRLICAHREAEIHCYKTYNFIACLKYGDILNIYLS